MKKYLFICGWLMVHAVIFGQETLEIDSPEEGVEIDFWQELPAPSRVLRLNQMDYQTLCHFLPAQYAARLAQYRERYGNWLDRHELYQLELPDSLREYLFLRADFLPKPWKKTGGIDTHFWQTNYQRSFPPALSEKSKGSPDFFATRYRLRWQNGLQISIAHSIAAGEKWLERRHPFFWGAHLHWQPKGALQEILIGDYHVLIGQGVHYYTARTYGKSSQVLQVEKQRNGIFAQTSWSRTDFLRGVAMHFRIGRRLKNWLFVGYRGYSASEDKKYLTSLYTPIRYDTEQALRQKNNVHALSTGTYWYWQHKKIHLGWSGLYQYYSLPFVGKMHWQNLNRYKHHFSTGIDGRYENDRLRIFMEMAMSFFGTYGALLGTQFPISAQLTGVALARHYSAGYNRGNQQGFGQNSENETGAYLGMHWQYRRRSHWSGYLDVWKSPQEAQPERNWEIRQTLHIGYTRTHFIDLQHQFRWKNQAEKTVLQQAARLYITYALHEGITAGNRIGINWRSDEQQIGAMIGQFIHVQIRDFPVEFYLYYVAFVANYYTRFYVYEKTLPSAYPFVSYNGKGQRLNAWIYTKIGKSWKIYFQYNVQFGEFPTKQGLGASLIATIKP